MWTFPFKVQPSYLKIFEALFNPHVRCRFLKRSRFKGKRGEANSVKTESHRKGKERGREGKGSVLPFYRNCFDTVSLLHEFSIRLCQSHCFKPQSCQMLVFYGALTWQPNLSVESVSFPQSQDLWPRKMYRHFWSEVSTLQQQWVGNANHSNLVPNDCYPNQCFHMKKTHHKKKPKQKKPLWTIIARILHTCMKQVWRWVCKFNRYHELAILKIAHKNLTNFRTCSVVFVLTKKRSRRHLGHKQKP